MVLEVATTLGSLLGGITAQFVAESTLQRLFGVVALAVAAVMLSRINRRNVILDPTVDPGKARRPFLRRRKRRWSSPIASSGSRSH